MGKRTVTDILLTLPQVADRLGCSTRTVQRRIKVGALKSKKDGGLRRVSEREVQRFIDAMPEAQNA